MSHHADHIALQARCEAQMELAVCHGCTACHLRCANGVQATRAEWDALQAYIATAPATQRLAIAHIMAQDKTVDLGDEVTITMCRYFDMQTKGCAVYPARPLVCRLLGHVEWLPCPIDKVPHPLPTPLALDLMHAYAKAARKTFTEWEQEPEL
jgi:Fe-S-cluster containining protein